MLMEVTAATGVLVLILLVALAAMEEITAPAVTGMAAVMITALATAPLTVMVPETVTAAVARCPAVAAVAEWERFPDVPPGFKKADADPARMALKRKADEGSLHPNNKKAKNEDALSDEEEEYPPKFSDFDGVRPVSFVPPTKLPPL